MSPSPVLFLAVGAMVCVAYRAHGPHRPLAPASAGVAMSPWMTGAIYGTALGLRLLLVVRRMPFMRRPPVDERISSYLRDLAGAAAPFTPAKPGSPFYAVLRGDAADRPVAATGAGVAMRPWLSGAILGTAFGLSLLLVVRRMPFLRRPAVETGSPFYAVLRVMLRIGRLPRPERVL